MAGFSLQVVEAFRRCTALRELEFGLHAHQGHSFSDATSLFGRILDVLPDSRLDRLAFVLDLGESSANVVPWAALDPKLSRVCVSHGQAVQVRIERHEARNPDRSWERMGYLDRRFWCSRLPTMKHKMLVQDRVRSDRRESHLICVHPPRRVLTHDGFRTDSLG